MRTLIRPPSAMASPTHAAEFVKCGTRFYYRGDTGANRIASEWLFTLCEETLANLVAWRRGSDLFPRPRGGGLSLS